MFRATIILTLLSGLITAVPVLAAPPVNDDAVAVVVGNRSYKNKHIPAVTYAHNDAAAMKRYLMNVLGYREGNIIYLKDATQAEMQSAFGNNVTHKGKLWRFIRKGTSDVTVFYSGHGVPGLKDKRGYLLPVDADPNAPEINGFPMDVLQKNLSQLGARSVTVYIDACFSGDSSAGILIKSASGITVKPRLPRVSKGMVMLTAAKADQVASWDETNKHGLFTYHLLTALYGKADTERYGDGNGSITVKEVEAYLAREMTYAARRKYGREQDASVQGEEATVLGPVSKDAPELAALQPATLEIDELKAVASPPTPSQERGYTPFQKMMLRGILKADNVDFDTADEHVINTGIEILKTAKDMLASFGEVGSDEKIPRFRLISTKHNCIKELKSLRITENLDSICECQIGNLQRYFPFSVLEEYTKPGKVTKSETLPQKYTAIYKLSTFKCMGEYF